MNRTQPSVVVFSLAFAALLLIAANAMASVVTNVDIPINEAVINPCNGETVTISGVDHSTATVTPDGAGGFHMTLHDNIHVTGTGSNSYEANQEDTNELNGRVGVEQTILLTVGVISEGPAPNFEENILEHVTVNPNGTVTAFLEHATANCRG